MTTIRTIKILDQHLGWALTAEYDHPAQAHKAWEAMAQLARTHNLGVYRHGLEDDPNSTTSSAIYVSAVSEDYDGIEIARRVLIDQHRGRPHDLEAELDRAMLARRAEVVRAGNYRHNQGGRILIRRPESHGARLLADGTMLEAPPGQG